MKLSVKQLEKKIYEHVKQYEKEINAETNKTKEVEADEYAETLEQSVDWEKAAKVKEAAKKVDEKLMAEEKAFEKKMKSYAVKMAEARNKRVHLRKLISEVSTTRKLNNDPKPKTPKKQGK